MHKVYKLSLKLLKKKSSKSHPSPHIPKFHKEMCIHPTHIYYIFIDITFLFLDPHFQWVQKSPETGCPNKKRENQRKKCILKYILKGSIKAYLFRTLIFATTEAVLFIYVSCCYFSKNRRVRFGDIKTKSISQHIFQNQLIISNMSIQSSFLFFLETYFNCLFL